MKTYFVKVFNKEKSGSGSLEQIKYCPSIEALWDFLKDHKDVSIYEAECVLDWS